MRVENWQVALNEYLISAQKRYAEAGDIVWGEFDCAIYASDWVHVCTGSDPMSEYRGRYKTRLGAVRLIKKLTGGTLQDVLNQKFGEPLENKMMAQRGDIAMYDGALGIVIGVFALMLGDNGQMSTVPLKDAEKVFKIG